jgi:hypothetical protein
MAHRRSVGGALAVIALITAACGGVPGSEGATTTAPATTVATTTTTTVATTTLPTTTTTTTSTTTLPPATTTTTLPPPVPVIGWEGEGLREVTVVIAFEYEPAAGLGDLVAAALEAMGLQVAADAGAVLTLTLTGIPRSASYGDIGTCFTGAQIQGTLSLTVPGQPTLRFDLYGDRPVAPVVIGGNCRENPEDAPFAWAFEPEFKDAMVAIWGPASVPYLTLILQADHGLVRLRTETVQAYRLMDPEQIPAEQQYEFMSAAVEFVGRSLHLSDDDIRTYREAVRGMLLVYSESDFGFDDLADIAAWQLWLAEWLVEQ